MLPDSSTISKAWTSGGRLISAETVSLREKLEGLKTTIALSAA